MVVVPRLVGSSSLSIPDFPLPQTLAQAPIAAPDPDLAQVWNYDHDSPPPTVSLPHEEELRFDLDGIPYFSPNLPLGSISLTSSTRFRAAYEPITVISVPSSEGDAKPNLTSIVQDYLEADDVLSPAWLRTVIVTSEAGLEVSDFIDTLVEEKDRLREGYGVGRILVDSDLGTAREESASSVQKVDVEKSAVSKHALRGPVLGKTQQDGSSSLLPVYRLQPDRYRSFIVGTYPTFNGSFRELRAVDSDGYTYIPIPPKLYSWCNEDDGICGKRIAVKDLYDLKGVKTSAGSRAWSEMYGKAENTASSIQILIDHGGQIVGKTKTATHAVGSLGHEETVDEQYPFSARGDGWQSCTGSSSGSACAMGAYPWLDLAVGSDTTGSVRGPAAVVGLYGNRPSHGVLEMDRVVALVPYQDTPGIFSRDPIGIGKATRSWYASSPLNLTTFPKVPSRILIDRHFGQQHTKEAKNITDHFIDDMKRSLGVEIKEIDLVGTLGQAKWTVQRLKDEISNQSRWFSWARNGEPFRKQYAAAHEGQLPPMDPAIRGFWDEAEKSNITEEDYHGAIRNLEPFRDLINEDMLGKNEESCSENIYLYSLGFGGHPLYREKDLNADVLNRTDSNDTLKDTNFFSQLMCPLSGCVDWTIPIGQNSYISNISRVEEMAPVTVSLVAGRGCDNVLAHFVEKLTEVGLVRSVKTGRTAY